MNGHPNFYGRARLSLAVRSVVGATHDQGARAVQSPSFRSTLYRYWFFGWLFRDVSRGSLIERAAAWRHNQAHARWLPVYLRRWAVLGGFCFAAGLGLEPLAPPMIQAAFYLPSALSVSINAVTLAAWMGLKFFRAPS